MGELKVVGKGFMNDDVGVMDEDGNWTVTVLFVETFILSDGSKKQEKIEAKSISKDFQEAHETALGSALRQLNAETTEKGFVSLVEAREVARLDSGNNNSNTNAG